VWAYRLYHLNEDGHYSSAPEVITADSDEEAIQTAHQSAVGDFELWHLRRLVASSKLAVESRPSLPLESSRT
jgi:hypothetical protein